MLSPWMSVGLRCRPYLRPKMRCPPNRKVTANSLYRLVRWIQPVGGGKGPYITAEIRWKIGASAPRERCTNKQVLAAARAHARIMVLASPCRESVRAQSKHPQRCATRPRDFL